MPLPGSFDRNIKNPKLGDKKLLKDINDTRRLIGFGFFRQGGKLRQIDDSLNGLREKYGDLRRLSWPILQATNKVNWSDPGDYGMVWTDDEEDEEGYQEAIADEVDIFLDFVDMLLGYNIDLCAKDQYGLNIIHYWVKNEFPQAVIDYAVEACGSIRNPDYDHVMYMLCDNNFESLASRQAGMDSLYRYHPRNSKQLPEDLIYHISDYL